MGDPGLVLTARVLPLAVLVFTRYSDRELARHRATLTELARDAEVSEDDTEIALVEGLQGLGGLTILGGLLCALFTSLSQSVLGSLSMAVMAFGGALSAIYGARLTWRRPALRPRRTDFWLAVAVGLLIGAGVLVAHSSA